MPTEDGYDYNNGVYTVRCSLLVAPALTKQRPEMGDEVGESTINFSDCLVTTDEKEAKDFFLALAKVVRFEPQALRMMARLIDKHTQPSLYDDEP